MNAHSKQEVAEALRTTTEVLANELVYPTEQEPAWSAFEWRIARAVASLHGVSALLSHTLRWRAPEDWLVFLKDQADHTARRHEGIQQLLKAINGAAQGFDIPVLPLKGAALYARGLYVPGTRPMADVDLLVREQDGQRAIQMLASLGYRETFASPRHIVFKPRDSSALHLFGEHAANDVKIELHTHISEALPLRQVDLTELLFPRKAQPGVNDYPAQSALLAHVLLHAAGAMVQRGLRLLHLQDVARLCSRMAAADWDDLDTRFADPRRGLWWAYPPLVLAVRYGGQVPPGVIEAAATGCPPMLKRACARTLLSDVSLSNPWIQAFPGIEWSRSTSEAFTYMERRLIPSRGHLRARQDITRNEPIHSTAAWLTLPQLQRMWIWVSSRPVRVATMHVVREALAQRP